MSHCSLLPAARNHQVELYVLPVRIREGKEENACVPACLQLARKGGNPQALIYAHEQQPLCPCAPAGWRPRQTSRTTNTRWGSAPLWVQQHIVSESAAIPTNSRISAGYYIRRVRRAGGRGRARVSSRGPPGRTQRTTQPAAALAPLPRCPAATRPAQQRPRQTSRTTNTRWGSAPFVGATTHRRRQCHPKQPLCWYR